MNYVTGILFCYSFSFSITTLSAVSNSHTITDVDSEPYKPMPPPVINSLEKETSYWRDQAEQLLNAKLNQPLNKNTSKNIIFFLGDGLSISTMTAARIYQGQLQNQSGEEQKLSFETFPYTGLAKTYCVDRQVPDSACTATAYLSGVKTNFRTIGVSANVQIDDCDAAKQTSNRPSSLIRLAQNAGKATGVVTNTRITHASPAGAYAHVPNRDMECDADVMELGLNITVCDYDIAKQLVIDEPGKNIKVILGGGRNKLLPVNGIASENGHGSRLDEDLVQEWKDDKQGRNVTSSYVTTVQDLKNVDTNNTEFLLGLFADGHMSYNWARPDTQPTLSQMTEVAIKMLQKESNGFVLFVEGGLIDISHHQNMAHISLNETVEFANAIDVALSLTSEEDTLIVVTADHSHTMTISGYPTRGFDILGLFGRASDSLPYSTISYANGPGYKPDSEYGMRYNLSQDDMSEMSYAYPGMVPKDLETHGGDDVAVYARGPWAHLFSGNYEQNYIPIAEAYAANISLSEESSDSANSTNSTVGGSNSARTIHVDWSLIIVPLVVYLIS